MVGWLWIPLELVKNFRNKFPPSTSGCDPIKMGKHNPIDQDTAIENNCTNRRLEQKKSLTVTLEKLTVTSFL